MRKALDRMEQALALPAQRPNWVGAVEDTLKTLNAELEAHAAEVERPGGLYSGILGEAPQLSDRVDLLRREHGHMATSIAETLEFVSRAEDVEEARRRGLALMGLFVRHRHHGADLLYDAYDLEIGGSD